MKTKKTIRRLPPIARTLAKLQRELFSLQRRMSVVIEEMASLEVENRAKANLLTDYEAKLLEVAINEAATENGHV